MRALRHPPGRSVLQLSLLLALPLSWSCDDGESTPNPNGGGGAGATASTSLTTSAATGQGGGGGSGGAEPDRTTCDEARGLMTVESIFAHPEDACGPWVDKLQGRAARVYGHLPGSASLWSRRTQFGTGLLVTAAHVRTACHLEGSGDEPQDCQETLTEPDRYPGLTELRLGEVGGGRPRSFWSVHFSMYNPFKAAGTLTSILPSEDVALFAVDSQEFVVAGTDFGLPVQPIVDAPLPLHDPAGLTLLEETWAEPEPEASVLSLGFPQVGDHIDELHASVGRVLGEEETLRAFASIAGTDDVEADIPYDPAVEFLLEGVALPGMSGGGVYDEAGRQVGLLVRSFDSAEGLPHLRVVRMSHLVTGIERAFAALTIEEQEAVRPYLETR